MLLTFEGHACVRIKTAQTDLLIDPYINNNPLCKKTLSDFTPDIILVTHGHYDHLGDAIALARACGATLLAQADLLSALDTHGITTLSMNTGGSICFRDVRITMTAAWHGSSVTTDTGVFYGGIACGFIIGDGNYNVYHAGDTALFSDLREVIARRPIDCALLPIGDVFTMGPEDAVTAAEWLQAKLIIPIHYNTFPAIRQDAVAFAHSVERKTVSSCRVLDPGQSIEL